jgi:hypothetical protein
MGRHAKGLVPAGESWDTLGGPDPGGREDEISGPTPGSQAMSSLPRPGASITE